MPANTESVSRFDRQLGVVHQDRVEHLVVSVCGSGPALQYLLINLVLLGVGRSNGAIVLRCGRDRVEWSDVSGQPLLCEEDIDQDYEEALIKRLQLIDRQANLSTSPELATAAPVLIAAGDDGDESVPEELLRNATFVRSAQICATGVFIGERPVPASASTRNVLTAPLSCLAASLLAQELLLRTRCLRTEVVAKQWVSLNALYRSDRLAKLTDKDPLPYHYCSGDRSLRAMREPSSHPHELLVRILLPDDSSLAAAVRRSVQEFEDLRPLPEFTPLVWSPCETLKLEDGRLVDESCFTCSELSGRKVFIAGVGALGSWLSMLFNLAGTRNCELTIADMDATVKSHNLNRQVLYRPGDLGRPKVDAAKDRLAELNPNNVVWPFCAKIDASVLDCAAKGALKSPAEFAAAPDFVEGAHGIQTRKPASPALAHVLLEADAVATCLDNLKARYLLNVLCEAQGIPLINAAAQDLDARVHRIDPKKQDPCLVCREGEDVRRDEQTRRCHEEGDVSIQSIVTCSAISASIQTVYLLLRLAGADGEGYNFVSYDGRTNRLMHVRSKPRWEEECPDHLFADQFENYRFMS